VSVRGGHCRCCGRWTVGVPLALTQFVKHNHVLHQRVLLVTVVIEEAPRIADEDRAEVIEIIEGITPVILHFGFMQ
jgi:KUP system potassium uptake protein